MFVMSVGESFFKKNNFLNIKGELVDFSQACVMGILNITPDSFYSGSRFNSLESIRKRANQIFSEGGKIIDVGAYSSRPGAENISADEEKFRLKPALKLLRDEFPNAIVSLDTFRSDIAQWAVEEFGISIINDISGGTADKNMFSVIAKLHVPYILMHMRGTPQSMVSEAEYNDVVKEVIYELAEKTRTLHELGVCDIIIDPGFGFAKSIEQNFNILHHLEMFHIFEHLLLVGVSRKSMIYKLLHISPEEALNGTTVLNTLAIQKGADILRVHDVKEAVEVIKIMKHPHFTKNMFQS